ncbi:MAG: hypothetical protein WCP14_01975 [bacterium]
MSQEIEHENTEFPETPYQRLEKRIDKNELLSRLYIDITKPLLPSIVDYKMELESKEQIDVTEYEELCKSLKIWVEMNGRFDEKLFTLMSQLREILSKDNTNQELETIITEIVQLSISIRENNVRIKVLQNNLPRLKESSNITSPVQPEYYNFNGALTISSIISIAEPSMSVGWEEIDEMKQAVNSILTEKDELDPGVELQKKMGLSFYEYFVQEARKTREEAEKELIVWPYRDYLVKQIKALSDENLEKARVPLLEFYQDGDFSETEEKIREIGGHDLASEIRKSMNISRNNIADAVTIFTEFDKYNDLAELIRKRIRQVESNPQKDSIADTTMLKRLITEIDGDFLNQKRDLIKFLIEAPGLSDIFGETLVDIIRTKIKRSIIDEMTVINDHSDLSVRCSSMLLSFKDPEAVKINVLNAFREVGYSGGWPYIDQLPGYLESLSSDDLRNLIELPKELLDFILFIKANPNTLQLWYQDSGEKSNFDNDREFRRLLRQTALYFANNGTEEERFFIIGIMEDFPEKDKDGSENVEQAKADHLNELDQALQTATNPRVIASLVEIFQEFTYKGDLEYVRTAILVLLNNYERLGKSKNTAKMLLDALFLSDKISESGFELYGQVHGVTKEQVTAASEYVAYITDLRANNELFYDLYLSEEALPNVFILAEKPGFKDFINKILGSATDHTEAINYTRLCEYLVSNPELFSGDDDIEFFSKVIDKTGLDNFWYFIDVYQDTIESGSIKKENRELLLDSFMTFVDNITNISDERISDLEETKNSELGQLTASLFAEGKEATQILLDISCYKQFDNPIKLQILTRELENYSDADRFQIISRALRWLTEDQVTLDDTVEQIQSKLEASLDGFKEGFVPFSQDAAQIDRFSSDYIHIRKIYDEIVSDLNIKPKNFKMPVEFLREFVKIKREHPNAIPLVEMAKYIAQKIIEKGSAYTTGDIFYEQLGSLEDKKGRNRRKSNFTPEQLIETMEHNIESSVTTWNTALLYQRENPESPVFLLANERTGPADVAAEYLPEQFAKERKILQELRTDDIRNFVRANKDRIEAAFEEYEQTGALDETLITEAKEAIGYDDELIIPIYGTKIPSSLSNASKDEPEGIDEYLTFLKMISMLGGRALFMDESTRRAPRSLECLYNFLNRRQESLGGVTLRFFGKTKDGVGEDHTKFVEIMPTEKHMEVAFVDPWTDYEKPINDDSQGFVPEIIGKAGFVEISKPSQAALSHTEGLSTLQDLWKTMIAIKAAAEIESKEE